MKARAKNAKKEKPLLPKKRSLPERQVLALERLADLFDKDVIGGPAVPAYSRVGLAVERVAAALEGMLKTAPPTAASDEAARSHADLWREHGELTRLLRATEKARVALVGEVEAKGARIRELELELKVHGATREEQDRTRPLFADPEAGAL